MFNVATRRTRERRCANPSGNLQQFLPCLLSICFAIYAQKVDDLLLRTHRVPRLCSFIFSDIHQNTANEMSLLSSHIVSYSIKTSSYKFWFSSPLPFRLPFLQLTFLELIPCCLLCWIFIFFSIFFLCFYFTETVIFALCFPFVSTSQI